MNESGQLQDEEQSDSDKEYWEKHLYGAEHEDEDNIGSNDDEEDDHQRLRARMS